MARSKPRSWRDVPNSVVALGFVALFMDVSSELVHSLLPLFLVDTLGASLVTVGVIEGVAEATAAITKMFSGVISDRIGKRKLLTIVGYGLSAITKPIFPLAGSRKLLTVVGYGLSAITKPIFPLAGSIVAVFAARFLDRIGKGIRDSPRDALVADITPPEIRGAAFGLRQALDTIGGVAGPVLAMALMILYVDNFRAVFWWATIPAAIAVALLIVGVREPAGVKPRRRLADRRCSGTSRGEAKQTARLARAARRSRTHE